MELKLAGGIKQIVSGLYLAFVANIVTSRFKDTPTDCAMKELDDWVDKEPMTVERYQEYQRCKKNLDSEYKETVLCHNLSVL